MVDVSNLPFEKEKNSCAFIACLFNSAAVLYRLFSLTSKKIDPPTSNAAKPEMNPE